MEIVLIVAVLVVAVAVLYVTVTFSTRTRQSTAPLIDDAFKGVSGQIDAAAQNLRRQLADELERDREQLALDGRKTQGRLDHADSRASSMANQILAELDTIRRLVEQLGARQDQLGGDLGKLDLQVARLGESLARPSAAQPPADDAPAGPAPGGGPAAVPGQLYAERLQFAFVLVSPESFSRSDRRYRVQVERQVGVLPIQPGARYDPAAIIHRAEGDEGFRERLGKAASDYVATKLGDPAFAVATERWVTQDNYPETALIEVCHRISSGLGIIVEKPLEEIGTELRLPGPEADTAAGIGAALVLRPVTEPLGRLSTFVEITGVVVGVATGLHPLALAAAKTLAHDRFHDFVARGFREAARQVFEGSAEPAESPEPARPVAEAPQVSAPTIGAPATISPETGPAPTAPSPSILWGPPSASRPDPVEPADPVRPEWPDDPAVEGPGFG